MFTRSQEPRRKLNNTGASRLLAQARLGGVAHGESHQRQSVRYNYEAPLEVRVRELGHTDAHPALMHNVSGGGIALLMESPINEGVEIQIRERSDEGSREWFTARVVHCQETPTGYRVGLSFSRPLFEGGSDDRASRAPVTKSEPIAAKRPAAAASTRYGLVRCAWALGAVVLVIGAIWMFLLPGS